jgi:dihydrofolate synthase/folylpolyglutamate synthase
MSPTNDPPARLRSAPGEGASLAEWLTYLESIHPTDIDLGLDRVLLVYRRLFRRNPRARIVTVGGTNGKGSAVVALEHLLGRAGRRTGTYTSPHLQRYNERVRIDGKDVSDDTLVRAFEAVEAVRGPVSLTYFEFGTLAAFLVFNEAGVDDWVLEVGLGGRLDAVNILDSDLAIITSVDIDHVAFLGNDVETIGFEKAGILRPDRPAIFADVNPPLSVLQQARAQNIQLLRPGMGYRLLDSAEPGANTTLVIDGDPAQIALPSVGLPVNSLAAAAVAIRQLEPNLAIGEIERVLAGLALPGRFERLQEIPQIIVDVGHNPHAARWLSSRLSRIRRPGQRLIAVYGALGDKDVEGVIAAMSDQVDLWFPAALEVPRGLGCRELCARMALPETAVAGCSRSVRDAVLAALAEADDNDVLIIFGSFFTVAAAREVLL